MSEKLSPTRRALLATSAAAGVASAFSGYSTPAAASDAIRPFRVNVPEEQLVDLRRRISMTRWPDRETVADQSQGPQLATLQELARYWVTEYDWRKCEARLNALPNFITEIDGLDIHFIHVRSKHENALAAHRHARLARLGHRAAEDYRSTDRSHRTWRKRGGCFRSRDPVNAGLRVFGQTGRRRAGTQPTSRVPGSC